MKKFYAILLNDAEDRFKKEIDYKGYNFIIEDVADEYHSMHELYQHRMALNIALFNFMYMVDVSIRGEEASYKKPLYMKSKLHNDGTMFEGGYFIVMAITPEGQISYHYKLEHWDKFRIPIVERTPPWDGHNSEQVMERLMKL